MSSIPPNSANTNSRISLLYGGLLDQVAEVSKNPVKYTGDASGETSPDDQPSRPIAQSRNNVNEAVLRFKPSTVAFRNKKQPQVLTRRGIKHHILFHKESSSSTAADGLDMNPTETLKTSSSSRSQERRKKQSSQSHAPSMSMQTPEMLALNLGFDLGFGVETSTPDTTDEFESKYWDEDYDPSKPTDFNKYRESEEWMLEEHDWKLYLEANDRKSDDPRRETIPIPVSPPKSSSLNNPTNDTPSTQPKTDFAKRLLMKYGWKPGQGLGSQDRQGITKALRLAPVRRGARGRGRIIDKNK